MGTIQQYFYEKIDQGLNPIPVRAKFNEKKRIWECKIPLIRNWQSFCDTPVTYDDVDSWQFSDMTGMGIVLGQSCGLMCVDIDEKDDDIKRRLLAKLPPTPLEIIGNPEKGGKFIYRTPSQYLGKQIYSIKNQAGEVSIEFFFGRKQVVIPPSVHSKDEHGNIIHRYKYKDPEKAEYVLKNIDLLPEFDPAYITLAEEIVRGTAPQSLIDANSPVVKSYSNDGIEIKNTNSEGTGRHNDMVNLISKLMRNNLPLVQIARELKKHDLTRNKENPYFADPTKGFTKDYDFNVYSFIFGVAKNYKEDVNGLKIDTPDDIWPPMVLNKHYDPRDLEILSVPPSVREFCRSCNAVSGIPTWGAYLITMTVISPLIGNKRTIRPKIHDSFSVTPNLYVILCQPSGSRKSEIIKRALWFLDQIQKRHDNEMSPIIAERQLTAENNAFFIAQKEKLIEENRKIIALSSNDREIKLLLAEIEQVKKEIDILKQESKQVSKKTFLINNVTYEKAIQIVEETQTGNLIYQSELKNIISLQKKKGYEKFRDFILNGRDGDNKLDDRTKHAGEVYLEKLTLSLLTATQPDVLSYYLKGLTYLQTENDGYWQRFLYIYSAYDTRPEMDYSYDPSSMIDLQNKFHEAYQTVPSNDPVRLDPAARELWFNIANKIKKIQPKVRKEYQPLVGKMSNHVLAMAYLDAFFRYGDVKTITLESMEIARDMFEIMFTNMDIILNAGIEIEITNFIRAVKKGDILNGDRTSKIFKILSTIRTLEYQEEFIRELVNRHVIRIKSHCIEINPEVFHTDLQTTEINLHQF